MLRVALRGLLARKLRSALTAVAVVVGVAFVSGTFVFTDTIDAAFTDLFERTEKGVDVSVRPPRIVDTELQEPPTMPASVLARVRGVPGVEAAEGIVQGQGLVLDRRGRPLTSAGPPTLLLSTRPERFQPLDYVAGRAPAAPGEAALDRSTARKLGHEVGSRVTVAGRAPARAYTVSGIVTLGEANNLGGARVVVLTVPEAQRITGHRGYDEVVVAAAGGTSPEALKARLQRALGDGFAVRTGKEEADRQAKELRDDLGFLRTALLVFAGVALLVGAFLIFNTFAVTVAQRAREFALLRTLGASRGQLLRSVLVETVVIGLLASALGVLGGLALAPGLRGLLGAFGVELPGTGTVVAPRTIVAGFAVGLLATVLSGVVPARRATQVQPVEAMRESATPGVGRVSRGRVAAALALLGAGVALVVAGLAGVTGSSGGDAGVLGGGAVAMMLGTAVLAPVLVRPLARAVGAPLRRLQGLPGTLARENAVRQPQRTAVTASALMVGLALVVFVVIFAAGIRASVGRVVEEQVSASLVVVNQDGFSPIPAGAARRLAAVPGVTTASALRYSQGRVRGVPGTTDVSGVEPRTIASVLHLQWERGSDATLRGLRDDQAVVDGAWARDHGLGVNRTLSVLTPAGRREAYRIVGTFENAVGLTGNVIVTNAALSRAWGSRDDAAVLAAGTGDAEALDRRADAALRAFPAAEAMTTAEYQEEQSRQVDQLLGLVFALLSLSVIVALLGIVNTLALSVHERTRELGMLRAVGMSRRQVRRMVRSEAIITAVIGALLGLVLGVALAALVSRPLADEGFTFAIPVTTLAVLPVLAAVAGVVAAIPPARRAARVDVLRAVTTE